jgi:hypothetical protein
MDHLRGELGDPSEYVVYPSPTRGGRRLSPAMKDMFPFLPLEA